MAVGACGLSGSFLPLPAVRPECGSERRWGSNSRFESGVCGETVEPPPAGKVKSWFQFLSVLPSPLSKKTMGEKKGKGRRVTKRETKENTTRSTRPERVQDRQERYMQERCENCRSASSAHSACRARK